MNPTTRLFSSANPGDRRWKRFLFSEEWLEQLLQTGRVFRVTEGIPAGAKFVGCFYEVETHTWQITLQHPDFAVVPEAGVIPTEEFWVEEEE